MKLIKSWAYIGARNIAKNLGESHEKRNIYYYSLQVIIGEFIKLLMILLISLVLGFIKPVAISLAAFIFLRTAAGGYHMNTHGKCVIASVGMFIAAGAILHYTYSYWILGGVLVFLILSSIFSLWIILRRAPADTPNKPITKMEDIKRLKRKSIIYLFICTAISIFLAAKGLNMYALAVISGILLEIFTVTATGYRFFEKISGNNHR